MTGLRVGLATNVAQILPQSAHGGRIAAVPQLLLPFLFVKMLLLVVRLDLVRVLKVRGAELAGQHQTLAALAEPRKVVIATVASGREAVTHICYIYAGQLPSTYRCSWSSSTLANFSSHTLHTK